MPDRSRALSLPRARNVDELVERPCGFDVTSEDRPWNLGTGAFAALMARFGAG